jgi:hypothetical protein
MVAYAVSANLVQDPDLFTQRLLDLGEHALKNDNNIVFIWVCSSVLSCFIIHISHSFIFRILDERTASVPAISNE